MAKSNVALSIVLLVLVSTVFFPSAQQAFAISSQVPSGVTENVSSDSNASDITVENGGTLIIEVVLLSVLLEF